MTLERVLAIALLGVVIAGALPALASEADEGDEGKRLYRVHCMACHGEAGRGDGQMRNQLDVPVPDLTSLAVRNGDEFPTERVHQLIDGRHETPSHGTREMPVWGFTFQSAGQDTDQEREIQEMITALTRYLESLQVNREALEPDASRD